MGKSFCVKAKAQTLWALIAWETVMLLRRLVAWALHVVQHSCRVSRTIRLWHEHKTEKQKQNIMYNGTKLSDECRQRERVEIKLLSHLFIYIDLFSARTMTLLSLFYYKQIISTHFFPQVTGMLFVCSQNSSLNKIYFLNTTQDNSVSTLNNTVRLQLHWHLAW